MELALAMSAEAAHGSSQDCHEEGAPSSSAPAELSTDTPVAQHVDATPDETALQSKVRDCLDDCLFQMVSVRQGIVRKRPLLTVQPTRWCTLWIAIYVRAGHPKCGTSSRECKYLQRNLAAAAAASAAVWSI